MARTLAEIKTEIRKLEREAAKARSAEIREVVSRIREAVAHYGLTPVDIFGRSGGLRKARSAKADKPGKAGRGRAAGSAKRAKAAKAPAVARYKDEAGNTWVGRGKRPQWLRDALASGKKLEDFAIK